MARSYNQPLYIKHMILLPNNDAWISFQNNLLDKTTVKTRFEGKLYSTFDILIPLFGDIVGVKERMNISVKIALAGRLKETFYWKTSRKIFRLLSEISNSKYEFHTCSNRVTAKIGQRGLYLAIIWADFPVRVNTMMQEALHLNEASTTEIPVISVISFEIPVSPRRSEKYLSKIRRFL